MFAAPGALGSFVQLGGHQHGLETGGGCLAVLMGWRVQCLRAAVLKCGTGRCLNSRATTWVGVLCGGSNLASALSLNACPLFWLRWCFLIAPGLRVLGLFYGGDNYCDYRSGAVVAVQQKRKGLTSSWHSD